MAIDQGKTTEELLQDRELKLKGLSTFMTELSRAKIMGDPLQDFFGAAEIWENVVPVAPEEQTCLTECTTTYLQARAACLAAHAEGSSDLQACLIAAKEAWTNCTSFC